MMGRKTALFLKLSNTYYAFGCKKYICKKGYRRNRLGYMVGILNTCKGFACVKFSYLLGKGVVRYGLDAFYICRGCLFNKNISLNE